jgi:hypothetical protein
MKLNKRNRPILKLPESHPAHRLLRAFVECWDECAGCEIALPGENDRAIDQQWHSQLSQRVRTFSGFVYEFLCFDLVLVEWLEHPPFVTPEEQSSLQQLDLMEGLLDECKAAAVADGNSRIAPLIDRVSALIAVWRDSIQSRIAHLPTTAS